MTSREAALRAAVTRARWPRPRPGYHYDLGPADFALREGTFAEYVEPPFPLPDGAPRACFGNAICAAALTGLPYVEGFAFDPAGSGLPIHHAWNLHPEGGAVDVTWRALHRRVYGDDPPAGQWVYLGVVFSAERADDATWNGDASVLDDFNRRWPLLREPWAGEDEDKVWPASERLDLLRASRAPGAVLSRGSLERVLEDRSGR